MGVLTEEIKKLVREQSLGFVATVCADGTPNLSPKGTRTVWDDDHLVFRRRRLPRNGREPAREPGRRGQRRRPHQPQGLPLQGHGAARHGAALRQVIAWFGTAEAVIQRDLAGRVRTIVLVKVERALPLVSPVYEWGKTEDEVRAWWTQYWEDVRAGRPVGPQP